MENNNLKSRREFFKEAARKALPIFGVVLFASSLIFTACTKEPACSDCTAQCALDWLVARVANHAV